jgi:hypothetical protein
MDSQQAGQWTSVRESVRDLAAVFDKRSLAGAVAVADNIAELRGVWLGVVDVTPAGNVELLRAVAGGCGPTAFAVAAALADEQPPALQEQYRNHYTAAVLLGLAEWAYQLAVRQVKDSSATTPDPARLPGTQFAIARMRAALATMTALLTRVVATRVELAGKPAGAADGCLPRYYIATEAEHVVSTAYEVIGRADTEAATRIGQLWRDIKTAATPPYTADLARELIGKVALGIDPNETPRWL